MVAPSNPLEMDQKSKNMRSFWFLQSRNSLGSEPVCYQKTSRYAKKYGPNNKGAIDLDQLGKHLTKLDFDPTQINIEVICTKLGRISGNLYPTGATHLG